MRIGITGDTHGSKTAMRLLLKISPPVDYWLHTGDYGQDGSFLAAETKLPLIAVAGNTDPMANRANVDELFSLEGSRIWLTHGHNYMHGYETGEIAWWARRLEADIAVFGHTHVPLVKWYGQILLVNPGSPLSPRDGNRPSFAVLTLNEGQKPEAEILRL
ncbi:MAG: metallophosphoesterase [Acholeplasmataceae bacterium]|nr:metallophosphoesterase [Acidaminococcaceae bacterium]NLY83915.1 metallophosphoesterase [Acholeplasmataceae bacterium]